jgi:phenylpropionate dioxygenase-like ring-hydroxylating dioxygenase large terminal subunit
MVTRPDYSTTRFGGYFHREAPAEDAELTHVGRGTPGGEYLRRFWQPICFSDELHDLPHRIKILGEELVAFRNRNGAVGLLELHCAHRGTSLEFGQIEAQGIRCCYHGWLFGVDGAILETPGEPAMSTLKDHLCQGAYPTHEYQGIVFAYLGPPDRKPPFPIYDSFIRPGYRTIPGRKYFFPCNWLQQMENAVDPAHVAFLHTIGSVHFTGEFRILPELEFRETPLGVVSVASRRVGQNIWIRMSGECIMPNLQAIAPVWEDGSEEHGFSGPAISRWIVPTDDTNAMLIEFRHVSETEGATPAWLADRDIMLPGQLPPDSYEASQRQPSDYDAQVSQRAIAVHALEHLGATDRGITMFRSQARRGIRAVQAGQDPIGVCRDAGAGIPTYCNNIVVHVPPEANPEMDRQLIRETGRRLADACLKNPPLMAELAATADSPAGKVLETSEEV